MVKIIQNGTDTGLTVVEAFGLMQFSQFESSITLFKNCGVKHIDFDGDDITIDVEPATDANHGERT